MQALATAAVIAGAAVALAVLGRSARPVLGAYQLGRTVGRMEARGARVVLARTTPAPPAAASTPRS